MKSQLYIIFIITISFGVSFSSCTKEKYMYLTEAEKAFLVYNEGDVFKLLEENTGDTLGFEVNRRYIGFRSEKVHWPATMWIEEYAEEGMISFSGGRIFVSRYTGDYFEIYISINEITFDYYSKTIEEMEVHGVVYKDVDVFMEDYAILYFSKEYGFLKIEDSEANVLYSIIH